MGVLYRTPEGFLDLTGQRVGGRYPREVSDSAVPVLDVTGLLNGRLLASEGGISLTSAIGDEVAITVPDNEVWLVLSVGLEFDPGNVGFDVVWKFYLRSLPGSTAPVNKFMLGEISYAENKLAATALLGDAILLPQPVAVPAGAEIVAEVSDSNNAFCSWSQHIGIAKMVGN